MDNRICRGAGVNAVKMINCPSCGKVIFRRDPKNIGINIVRWDYWSSYQKFYNAFKNVKKAQDLIDKLKEKILQEYKFDPNEVEKRHRELLDINIKNVSEEVMDFIKFSMFNYVMGKYISSIVICGAAAEYLLDDLIFITDLTKSQKKGISDIKSHGMKLLLCKYAGIIDNNEYSMFEEIRQNRNDYAHPKNKMIATTEEEAEKIRNQRNKKSKEIAKKCIRNLINLANKVYSKQS